MSASILVYHGIMVASIHVIYPTPFALMQLAPSHSHLQLHCWDDALIVVVLARFTPNMLDQI